MARTGRLSMPLLVAGQAQKEITHNEALIILDCIVHGVCSGGPSNAPPSQPIAGCAYICGSEPQGDWLGHAGDIACWTSGGWRFVKASDGIALTDIIDGSTRRYLDGQWSVGILSGLEVRIGSAKVVGPQRPAIAAPIGGVSPDAEARTSIAAILDTLRAHGLIAT